MQGPPSIPPSPSQSRVIPPVAMTDSGVPTEEDEDKSRRAGIAARMARLGGVKFGMAPSHLKRQSTSSVDSRAMSEGPMSPIDAPQSPIDTEPALSGSIHNASQPPQTASTAAPDDESPEGQAARKRATLARLRAGGALGFGMFNHGPASPSNVVDPRGLEQEITPIATEQTPPVPSGRSGGPAPASAMEESDEQGETPTSFSPPPVPTGRPMPPTPGEEGLPSPLRSGMTPMQEAPPFPASPVRAMSNTRPAISPVEKRMSQQQYRPPPAVIPEDQSVGPPVSQSGSWQMSDEPAVMMMDQSIPSSPHPPPPGRPAPVQQYSQSPQTPRRSMSTNSHASGMSMEQQFTPASRQNSRTEGDASRPSVIAIRPSFNELQQASKDHGSRLIRAARAMFDQGKKANFGDGSAVGFVLVAIDQAHIPRPQQSWGQLVYEQDGASVMRRYDEVSEAFMLAILR